MARQPTLAEQFAAFDVRNRRRGQAEKLLRLRYQGWSHSMVMEATKRPERRAGWADSPRAWLDQLDLYEHGIIPPTTTRKSGRIRRDARKTTGPLFVHLYRDV